MSPQVWLVILLVGFAELLAMPLIIRVVVSRHWAPIPDMFPPTDPAPDAVTKGFQSFRAGVINLGFSIDASVDDACLHVRPSKIGRVIGVRPASIPWESITPVSQGRTTRTVKIAGVKLMGPKWCLEIADPPGSDPPT